MSENKKLRVALFFGGVSSEHEISCVSASAWLRALREEPCAGRYEVFPIGITKAGRWLACSPTPEAMADGSWEQGADCVPCVLSPDRGDHGVWLLRDGKAELVSIDICAPVLHGKNGEDGTIQGLLETAGIPYVGCGVLGSAVCMDKVIANCVMEACGIARCQWDYVEAWQMGQWDAIAARLEQKLGWPMFVKPANAGSSVGISKAGDRAALDRAVELALAHDSRVVFERFVDGQEVECAVRGNEDVTGTLPGEILASAEFYTYDDKYVSGTSRTAIPARLSREKLEEVRAAAVRAYRALCCRGLARVDFFVEKGTGRVLLNEINTMPGFTDISMYPKLMMDAGDSYASLLDSLIALALEARHG